MWHFSLHGNMKSQVFAVCSLSLIVQIVSPYRLDVEHQSEGKFCEFRNHLTFKPTATCCMNKVITPGINLTTHWEACGTEVKGKSSTLEGIGWDMYSCILKKSSDGKNELTLQDFADVVTASYPDDIKSSINGEIQKQTVSAAAFTDFGALEKIRVTYYDIETAVCEGTVGEGGRGAYGMIEKCEIWKEENHRSGMCCKRAYPVDIRFKSSMETDIETQMMLSMLCREEKLYPGLRMLNGTDIMNENIAEMCDTVCGMFVAGELDVEKDIIKRIKYFEFDVATELNRKYWLPELLHDDIIADAKQYVQSIYSFENTVQAMKDYEFADVIGGETYDWSPFRPNNFNNYAQLPNKSVPGENFKYDFMRRKFHNGIRHVPILCSAYREIATLMEYALYRNCKAEEPVQQEGEPKKEEMAEEPKTEEAAEEPKKEETGEGETR